MTEILIIRVKHSDQGIGVLLESSVELKETPAIFRDLCCQGKTGMIGNVNLIAV